MATKRVSLKLLIDKKGHRVLYAEAGKDFVDFLFYVLSCPLGTFVSAVAEPFMAGSLGKLYGSFENLSYKFMLPNVCKATVLEPKLQMVGAANNILSNWLTEKKVPSKPKKFYMCSNHKAYLAQDPRASCPYCRENMSLEVQYVAQPATDAKKLSGKEGFVDGAFTFMIMDDLEVKPMCGTSVIALLKKFNVKEVGDLEEKVVSVGTDEGLYLLTASLRSKSVLTEVFLGQNVDGF